MAELGCKKFAAIKPPNLFCLLSVEQQRLQKSVGIGISPLIFASPLLLPDMLTFVAPTKHNPKSKIWLIIISTQSYNCENGALDVKSS